MPESFSESGELMPCLDLGHGRRTVRVLYAVALALSVSTLTALALTKTQLIVEAPAIVIPTGETARVSSVHDGSVAEILVHEGEAVEQGAVLIRLDARESRARADSLRAQLTASAARGVLLRQVSSERPQLFSLDQRIRAAQGEALVERLHGALSLSDARLRQLDTRTRQQSRFSSLVDQQAGALSDLEKAELDVQQARHELTAAQSGARELSSDVSRLGLERTRLARSATLAELTDAVALAEVEALSARLRGELTQTELAILQLDITAPRAGVVQNIKVLDRGDVIPAGALIANIVPPNAPVRVRARVTTDGIAWLRPGQRVRVRLDAYPFQEFGFVPGEVSRVAADATRQDLAFGESAGSLAYTIDVNVAADGELRVRPAPIRLRPGMTGKAQFIVRKERILTAWLRPFRGVFDSLNH